MSTNVESPRTSSENGLVHLTAPVCGSIIMDTKPSEPLPADVAATTNGSARPEDNNQLTAQEPARDPSASFSSGRKRRSRRKSKGGYRHPHKKWKPYSNLTWEEKRLADERESRRAIQKREQRFASGQPMAPYNTTQFLMEQYEGAALQFTPTHVNSTANDSFGPTEGVSGSGGESSDDFYDSPDDEEQFLEREFAETYTNFRAERLQNMTKEELMREYLALECKLEQMESFQQQSEKNASREHSKAVRDGSDEMPKRRKRSLSVSAQDVQTSTENFHRAQINKLESDLTRLTNENNVLKGENVLLKSKFVTTE